MTRQQELASLKSTESGFTIIEALLAIIIVSVLLTAIAPVIVLSVATRVQARRVELATQAARSYVDGVRSGAIATPDSVVVLRPFSPTTPVSSKSLDRAAPSTAGLNCTPPAGITPTPVNFYCNPVPNVPTSRPKPAVTNLYCMNMDGNPNGCNNKSSRSFVIQAFRSAAPAAGNPGGAVPDLSDDGTRGYILGIRVYRADAFDETSTLQKTATQGVRQAASFTGGLGNKQVPLVEVTTEVRGTEASDDTNYNNLCDRLGGCGR